LIDYFSKVQVLYGGNALFSMYYYSKVQVLYGGNTLFSMYYYSKVQVLYGGNALFDYEVDESFWDDVFKAFYALLFIVVFMFILTSFSLWLTVCGILSILCSFPLAIFFYTVVFDITGLGILNGAAAFVIIGIGEFFWLLHFVCR
jgi:hypothetical protein